MENLDLLIKKKEKVTEEIKKEETKLLKLRTKLKELDKDISFLRGEAFNDAIKKANITDDESLKLRRMVSANPDILRRILESEQKREEANKKEDAVDEEDS